MLRLFLSHWSGARDALLITMISEALAQYGVESFIAERHRKPGTPVTDKIESALRNSDVVLAVLTKDGQASAAVNQEIGWARASGKFVIPLVEKGVKPTLFLHGIDPIEYDPESPVEGLQACVEAINRFHAERQGELRKALAAQSQRDEIQTVLAAIVILGIAIALVIAVIRNGKTGSGVPSLPGPI